MRFALIARATFGIALTCVIASFAYAMAGNVLLTLASLVTAANFAALAWLNVRREKMGARDTELRKAIGRYLTTSRDLSPSERIVLMAGVAFPSIAVIALGLVTIILASDAIEAASAASAGVCAFSIALTCFVRLRIDHKRNMRTAISS